MNRHRRKRTNPRNSGETSAHFRDPPPDRGGPRVIRLASWRGDNGILSIGLLDYLRLTGHLACYAAATKRGQTLASIRSIWV